MTTLDDLSLSFGEQGAQRLTRAPSLPDEIAKLLHGEITKGTLKAGDRLPTEQQLCNLFGVSRPVVREAISQLKYDGVLESFQGRGVFVKQDIGASFRLGTPDLDDQKELAHILELLIAVEVAATGLAAERRSAAELAGIKRALDAMATAIEQGDSGVDEDFRFHRKIVEVTDNPFFIGFTGFLESRVRNLIRAARTTTRFKGLVHQVQKEHEAIYQAIEAGDPEAAKVAAERHLRNVAQRMRLYRDDSAED
jgi:DNA-binding FadR family transcriptional regulator